MRKMKIMYIFTSLVGVLMICIGLIIQNDSAHSMDNIKKSASFDINNIAASANIVIK